jgi:hypothetical protein
MAIYTQRIPSHICGHRIANATHLIHRNDILGFLRLIFADIHLTVPMDKMMGRLPVGIRQHHFT